MWKQHTHRRLNVHNAEAARRGVVRYEGTGVGGIRRDSIVARVKDRFVRVSFVRRPTPVKRRRAASVYAVYANIAEPRARRESEGKRERRFATSRFPDTSRPIGRETRPTRLRVSLLTYASHVDRSSRLFVQRVENISATLTCAAITTAAILDSPFHDHHRSGACESDVTRRELARPCCHLVTSHTD